MVCISVYGQVRPKPQPQTLIDVRQEVRPIEESENPVIDSMIAVIETALRSSSPAGIRPLLASRIAMNIRGLESGAYSANQAVSILEHYFSSRTTLSFSFSRKDFVGAQPFATGRLSYSRRGTRETAQVYVAFMKQENRWVVSEFNLY